jgi:predicted phosphodiesterase
MSDAPSLAEGAVALISDIHGDFVALRHLRQRLDSQGVEQVVCLGDAAATGAQPRECLDR